MKGSNKLPPKLTKAQGNTLTKVQGTFDTNQNNKRYSAQPLIETDVKISMMKSRYASQHHVVVDQIETVESINL